MTDGIGRLSGYGNYGVGGYVPQRREEVPQEKQPQPQPSAVHEEKAVDPEKVMEFLSGNNIFVQQTTSDSAAADTSTQERVGGYMERFEMIYGIIQEEFGEELAPSVMDLVMDRLMGM